MPAQTQAWIRAILISMFNPILRERGKDKLVYSTSMGFRAVFFMTAIVVIASVASVSKGPFFSRFNVLSLAIVVGCLLAGLYLERWTFDKKANVFEKNVGMVFLYTRRMVPLDTLQKVVLHAPIAAEAERPRLGNLSRRGVATLAVADRDGEVFRLDMARGSARELRKSAQMLSAFCSIPLEDDSST
jgi:hypothetical protein